VRSTYVSMALPSLCGSVGLHMKLTLTLLYLIGLVVALWCLFEWENDVCILLTNYSSFCWMNDDWSTLLFSFIK